MFSKKLYLNEKTLLTLNAPVSPGAKDRFSRSFHLFLAFCLLVLPLSVAQAQVTEKWVARYDGLGHLDDSAKDIAVDASGNIYVTGKSYGSETKDDYVTIKYDPDGNELWVAQYDNGSSDYANALAVDDAGNVYVTGESRGDYATVKYDTDGNKLWVAQYDNGSSDYARALAVDDAGNVYVTGRSYGSGTDYDYATVKYDPDGNELWVQRYNGPVNSNDYAYALAVDASGNVYVTGYSYGFGMQNDYATVKYDNDGNELWVRRYNGTGNDDDYAKAIAVDASGNVYVTGQSYGDGTSYDYATVKYDTDGNEIWVARYDGVSSDYAYALAVDASGNVYVTGKSYGSGTNYDYVTVKYDPDGNQLWVQRYNGTGNDDDTAEAIAVDASGNVYVTGYSYGGGTWYDYATVKYDSLDGNELWVIRYDGPVSGDDRAYAIAVDSSGNVYVTGESYGSGTGLDYATIKYSQEPEPALSVSPLSIDFGDVVVGETATEQVTVTNVGTADLIVSSIVISGVDADNFSVDETPFTLAPGESQTLDVSFTPDEVRSFSASLDIDSNGGSKSVTLTGSGVVPPSLTLVCKTDKPIYNPWESVQVLADVDNPGDSFSAKLLGGVIVFRTPPKKPIILTGEEIAETIDPGLNPDIFLYASPPIITVIAPKVTHGAFCILYTDEDGILAVDICTWGLTTPPDVAQEKFFLDLIRSYIDRYGLENLQNANAGDLLPAPATDAPSQTALGRAFPNTANPETWFPFQLAEPSEVTIKIYNASGQLVKTLDLGYQEAGYYLNREKAAFWDGRNERGERIASGIYFYTMRTRNFTATGKVVILK